jgi:hypothetical protein
MEDGSGVVRLFTIGRTVLWLVLALLLAAVIYAAVMSLTNWPAIGV